jgi:hypothetical protein
MADIFVAILSGPLEIFQESPERGSLGPIVKKEASILNLDVINIHTPV